MPVGTLASCSKATPLVDSSETSRPLSLEPADESQHSAEAAGDQGGQSRTDVAAVVVVGGGCGGDAAAAAAAAAVAVTVGGHGVGALAAAAAAAAAAADDVGGAASKVQLQILVQQTPRVS